MRSGCYISRNRKAFITTLVFAVASVLSQTASALSLTYASTDTPSLTVFNGRLFMAYTGTDSNHRLNYAVSSDGTTFTQVSDGANRAASGPAIAAFGTKTYVAFTGINDHRINIYSSTDGQHYSGQYVPNANWNSPWRVALASGGGYLYLSWLGYDNAIYNVRSSDGVNWASLPTIIPFPTPNGTASPVYPPTLATDSNGVVQGVFTQRFYYSFNVPTYQINIFTPGGVGGGTTCRTYVNGSGTQAGLGFLPGERLMPFKPASASVIGLDLNGGSCQGGTTYPTSAFPTDGSSYGTTGVAPAAVGFNGHAYLFWTGTDSAQHINVVQVF